MRNNKIVFVIPSLRVGGAEKMLITVANEMSKRNYEVHIIFLNENGDFVAHLDNKITRWNLKNGRVYFSIFKILKIVNKIKPDVLFSWMGFLNSYLIFFKFLFPKKIKWMCRETNIPSLANKMYKARFLFNFLYRFYNSYESIVCQSRFMANDLIGNFKVDPNKITLIPNPYSLIPDDNAINSPFTTGFINILFAGRFNEDKRVDTIVRSVQYLPGNFKLNLLGSGPLENALKEEVKILHLEDRVIFFGHQTNPERFYKNADYLILCSEFEGLPNVAIEAVCNGCPVVGYNYKKGLTSLYDIIDGTNGVVKDFDTLKEEELAKLILEANTISFDHIKIKTDSRIKFSLQTAIDLYEKTINK